MRGNIPQCYIFRIAVGVDRDGYNMTIAACEKSRMLSAGRMSPGSSKQTMLNAGPAISTLNSASTRRTIVVNSIESSNFVSRWRFASGNKDFPGAPLLRGPLRFRVDVGLSSPALHERNHDRSHDNKNDDDGKRFKRLRAQKLKHG